MQRSTIALLAAGCLVVLQAASVEARTLDSMAGGGGASVSPRNPGGSGGFSLPGPNSFPPVNDPGGRIGAVSEATAFVDGRIDWLSGTPETAATLSLNSGTLGAIGRMAIFAPSGIETRSSLTWDGEGRPGTGLGGQDLTAAPSGACAPAAVADRFVFDLLEGDSDVEVGIAVTDTAGNTATLRRVGLAAGIVPFRYADFDNAASVDFTSVDRIVVTFEGIGVALTLEEITTTCDPMDLDGDQVADAEDLCPQSDLGPTVVVGACDTGVRNALFPSGCTLGDLVARCTALKSAHGCLRASLRSLEKLDVLTTVQHDAIFACF